MNGRQSQNSDDSTTLAEHYPHDHYKTVRGNDGDFYDVRSFIGMGATVASYPEELHPASKQLAEDLLSPSYRNSISQLVGPDLSGMAIEANLFHYGAGEWTGPHLDLKTKVITHVLYFNDGWDDKGGGLAVLRSLDISDQADYVEPIVGSSVVLVRSENSWHAVTPVTQTSKCSRRSLTVTFYAPDSPSTMWPIGDNPSLHIFDGTHHEEKEVSRSSNISPFKRHLKRALG